MLMVWLGWKSVVRSEAEDVQRLLDGGCEYDGCGRFEGNVGKRERV
jgi:hypothetical protein